MQLGGTHAHTHTHTQFELQLHKLLGTPTGEEDPDDTLDPALAEVPLIEEGGGETGKDKEEEPSKGKEKAEGGSQESRTRRSGWDCSGRMLLDRRESRQEGGARCHIMGAMFLFLRRCVRRETPSQDPRALGLHGSDHERGAPLWR